MIRRALPGARPAWLRRPGADRLLAMWATLYPAPDVLDVVRRGSDPRPGSERRATFVVLPAAGGSRMLVPTARHVGAAMARSRSLLVGTLPHRALWVALALGLRAGVVQSLFDDRVVVDAPVGADIGDVHDGSTDLSATLGDLFGEPVELAVHVGRARANRKPVVQVLDRTGRTLGFCKVGWNDITRDLLLSEAATLRELGPLEFEHVVVPSVLFQHHRGGLDHLVVSPLVGSPWPARRRRERTVLAMREIAAHAGVATVPLAASTWWKRTLARAEELGGAAPGPSARAVLEGIQDSAGGDEVAFGRWHGDWTPWNMTMGDGGRVVAWDWERSDPDVPVGFDGLHLSLQANLGRDGMRRSLLRSRDDAAAIVGGFREQVAPPALTLRLYLVALHLRYAEDAVTIGDPALAASAADILSFLAAMGER